jgi:hypothetical protein
MDDEAIDLIPEKKVAIPELEVAPEIVESKSDDRVNSEEQAESKSVGIEVYNPHPYPVVVNEAGQSIGGRKTFIVDPEDKVLQKLLDIKKVTITTPPPKQRTKSKKK